MNFQTFRTAFQNYPVISERDIEKLFPDFDRKNLLYWQRKGYLQKLRNTWYRLAEMLLHQEALYFISNQIYQPSYVSLEMALSHYGFIPEGVFKITAISTLKTQQFQTPIGDFKYQNVKPDLFFGYLLRPVGDCFYKMAEPEKAILDYLYLHPEMDSEAHFHEMRFNVFELQKMLTPPTLHVYTESFQSKALKKRVRAFNQFIKNQ
jgi:predicted transcriptional regulator of viral defense system